MSPAEYARTMKEARRLRGQTAYDGFPAFGEPYGEWGHEKLSGTWGKDTERNCEAYSPKAPFPV